MILFYFILVYKAPRQQETTIGDNVFYASRKVLSLGSDTGCMFQKMALPSDFMHIFHDFVHVHSPWAGTDNPLGPKFCYQQEGLITMVICCKFEKNLFNFGLYTHLFMI